MKKLHELISVLPNYETDDDLSTVEVTGIQMDSREISKGDLFVCIDGFTVDGHDYVDQAAQNGAITIVAEKEVATDIPVIYVEDSIRALSLLSNTFYMNPTQKLKLIGVTGTNGKTSISHLLDDIFQYAKYKTGVIGTIEMRINNQAYPVKNTTPDALFLQQSFKKMVDEKIDVGVMEVSSHALAMGRVHGCDFDIAVFSNFSQDHLDYHETMEDYLHAKSLLFSQLGNRYDLENKKIAILNRDDPTYNKLKMVTAQPVVTYGIEKKATFSATEAQINAQGVSFKLKTPEGEFPVKSKLMGKFSIYNILASITSAYYAGISLPTIIEAIEHSEGIKGRFQPVLSGQNFGVIVDYAHTPDSLKNVLETINSFKKGKIYVVVGCGGDRDRTKRPLMAQTAVSYADIAFLTSDNPRSESPEDILRDMTSNLSTDNYQVIIDRKQAIEEAVRIAKKNDIILIAGKGHETYQIIGNEVIDFDDKKIAEEAINNR